MFAEGINALGVYFSNNSEPLLCRLEDGVVCNTGLIKIIFHGDALFRRGSELYYRLVGTGLHNYWISFAMHHH
jgi:hypothetical protein